MSNSLKNVARQSFLVAQISFLLICKQGGQWELGHNQITRKILVGHQVASLKYGTLQAPELRLS